MNADDMTPAQLRELADRKETEAAEDAASLDRSLAVLLHQRLCPKDHSGHLGSCFWFDERRSADKWEEPTHRIWLDHANTVIDSLLVIGSVSRSAPASRHARLNRTNNPK